MKGKNQITWWSIDDVTDLIKILQDVIGGNLKQFGKIRQMERLADANDYTKNLPSHLNLLWRALIWIQGSRENKRIHCIERTIARLTCASWKSCYSFKSLYVIFSHDKLDCCKGINKSFLERQVRTSISPGSGQFLGNRLENCISLNFLSR